MNSRARSMKEQDHQVPIKYVTRKHMTRGAYIGEELINVGLRVSSS